MATTVYFADKIFKVGLMTINIHLHSRIKFFFKVFALPSADIAMSILSYLTYSESIFPVGVSILIFLFCVLISMVYLKEDMKNE